MIFFNFYKTRSFLNIVSHNVNMLALDVKDKKILFELDIDSRQSFLSIGKKVKLSREVVNYRVNKLIENKIITEFTTILDISKIGITMFRSFIKLINLEKDTEQKIIDYLKSKPQIGWGTKGTGNWNINFIFWARTINEFTLFWNDFNSKFGDYIISKSITMNEWAKLYPKTFLLSKKFDDVPVYNVIQYNSDIILINNKELKILSLLASNSRINIMDIAKEVKLSATTIFSKIKFFEKNKIILAYSIGLNFSKIGYSYFVTHINFKNHTKKRYDDIVNYCNNHDNIWSSVHWIGGDDLELDVYIENDSKYFKLLDDFRNKFSDIIQNIEATRSGVAFKYNLFPIDIK